MPKHCAGCQEEITETNQKLVWSGTKNRRKIVAPKCKKCYCKDVLDRRKRKYGPQANAIIHLKTRYNLTMEQYEQFLIAHNNQCDICKSPKILHIDHDHDTGRIRGLLCNKCNQGIGLFNE